MNTIIIITCVLGVVNLLILIGIAGTVTKILQYLSVGKEAGVEDVMPSHSEHLLNSPTGPHYDGVTDRPSSNWDGVSVQE